MGGARIISWPYFYILCILCINKTECIFYLIIMFADFKTVIARMPELFVRAKIVVNAIINTDFAKFIFNSFIVCTILVTVSAILYGWYALNDYLLSVGLMPGPENAFLLMLIQTLIFMLIVLITTAIITAYKQAKEQIIVDFKKLDVPNYGATIINMDV